jgi:hypothetical protein
VIVFVAVLSIAAFLAAFGLLRIAAVAGASIRTSQAAAAAMRDPALDDRARERAVQAASLRLLGQFLSLLMRGALAVSASLVPIAAASAMDLAPADAVLAFLMHWPAWLLATAMGGAAWFAGTRLWRTN